MDREQQFTKIMKKHGMPPDPEELDSALQDYRDLSQQYSDLMTKFCYAEKPVRRSGVWCCPACGKRVNYHHTHCHWCGKKMGWGK